MIETDFFSPDEIEPIIIIYCTPKVESILANYQKTNMFLCSKKGFEGIFAQEINDESCYKPLLDLRNSINDNLREDQTINVILSDGELIVISCLSLHKDLSSNKVKKLHSILEKIKDTKYSPDEIKEYNSLIEKKNKKK